MCKEILLIELIFTLVLDQLSLEMFNNIWWCFIESIELRLSIFIISDITFIYFIYLFSIYWSDIISDKTSKTESKCKSPQYDLLLLFSLDATFWSI